MYSQYQYSSSAGLWQDWQDWVWIKERQYGVTSPLGLACLVWSFASLTVMETAVIYWGVQPRRGLRFIRDIGPDQDILHQHLTTRNIFLPVKYLGPCKMKYFCSGNIWLCGKNMFLKYLVSSNIKRVEHWYFISCSVFTMETAHLEVQTSLWRRREEWLLESLLRVEYWPRMRRSFMMVWRMSRWWD